MQHADKLETLAIDSLVPYARNARTHSPEQVAAVARSIQRFGFTNPVLIDAEGGIVAGHGRVMAAKSLGMGQVPCLRVGWLTEAEKRAYVLADNKLAELAGWDDELLAGELRALQADDFDLSLTGFAQDELDDLLIDKTEGKTDPDAVPPAPTIPVTQPGDVWVLGRHRIMCGDSTDAGSVALLMNGEKADMVFTDPPYGMSYGGGRACGDHVIGKGGGVLIKAHGMILGDDKTGDELVALVRGAVAAGLLFCNPGAAKYICFPWRTYAEFERALESCGMDVAACIVWDKKSIGLGNANYRPQHEFIFYIKGDEWYGDKAQADVWYMSRGATGDYVHPTQKPVELIQKAIQNSSRAGDTVLDLFGGSGSTLIACEQTGRINRSMELDPKYCDVIVRRWQQFTGLRAVRESDGVEFPA